MKLRIQVLITALLLLFIGANQYRSELLRIDSVDYVRFRPHAVVYGIAEDTWPVEANERRRVGEEAISQRIGGATALYTNYSSALIAVESDTLQLWGTLGDGVTLSPRFIVHGNRMSKPKEVTLQFMRFIPYEKKPDNLFLTIESGKELLVSQTLSVITTGGARGNAAASEVMEAKISYEAFKSAIESGDIRIEIGESSTRLNDIQLGKLKSMIQITESGLSFPAKIEGQIN